MLREMMVSQKKTLNLSVKLAIVLLLTILTPDKVVDVFIKRIRYVYFKRNYLCSGCFCSA